MNEQADPIDAAINVLKRVAQRQKKKTDWEKVDRDLRTVFVRLALANSTEVRGLMGETYRRVGLPDASVAEAKELLSAAKNAFRAAKRLPTVLSSFAVKTYGDAGRTSIPWEAMRAYTDAVCATESVRSLPYRANGTARSIVRIPTMWKTNAEPRCRCFTISPRSHTLPPSGSDGLAGALSWAARHNRPSAPLSELQQLRSRRLPLAILSAGDRSALIGEETVCVDASGALSLH
jgi:hypothetical protein